MYLIAKFQIVLNSIVKVVFHSHKHDYALHFLKTIYWMPVEACMECTCSGHFFFHVSLSQTYLSNFSLIYMPTINLHSSSGKKSLGFEQNSFVNARLYC